jgi:hypothetical protein
VYKIATFVNLEGVDQVKGKMFESGGGRIGNYDSCCFISKGIGQFRALKGSNPTIGEEGSITYVDEARIEMVVEDKYIKDVINALKKAHPYETPAYEVIRLEDL